MDKLQQVYDLYLSQGLLSDNISFEQFSSADEEQQNKLYTLGKEKGLFSSTGADTFKSAWGGQSFQTSPAKETASVGLQTSAVSTGSPSGDGLSELPKDLKADRERLLNTLTLDDITAKLIDDEVANITFDPTIKGTYMGATYEVIPYEEELAQAEETLKKSKKAYTQDDVKNEARNIIKSRKVKEAITANQEEILEEIKDKKVGYGRAWWDLATSLLPDSWGIGDSKEYADYRKTLTQSIQDPIAEKEYADGMLRLEINAQGMKKLSKDLSFYKNILDNGGTLNEAETSRYNNLLSELKAYESKTEEEVNNLTAISEKLQSIEELADLTKRSYSNVDIAQAGVANFFSSTLLGGLSKIEEKTSTTALVKEFTGVDLTNPNDLDMIPESLRGIVATTFKPSKLKEEIYSDIAEYGFEQGYRIKENVEKNQELGKVKTAEDFFEFTLNLFSEQAGNTAVTAGIPYAGLAIVSMGSAGQKMHEMDMERKNGQKISAAQYYGAALMSFAAEYLTEKVSLSNFNKLAKVNYTKALELNDAFSLDINKLTYGTAWGNWLKSQGGEGLAEAGSQFINNISDKYILGKDISLTDGLSESFASGAIMSGLGFNAPVLAADLVNAFSANKDIQAHNRVMADIVEITSEINKLTALSKTDPSVKPVIADLQSRLDSLYDQSITYIENAADRTDSLSKLDRQSLLNIDAEVYKLKKKIDAINRDPNLSVEAKRKQMEFLADSIRGLENHKETILSEGQYGKDTARARNFQNLELVKNGLQDNLQLIEAVDEKDFLQKAKDLISNALSDGKITDEQAKKLEAAAEQASQTKSHGFQFGAEFGLPVAVAMSKYATNGKWGNSTVWSHEISHGTLFRKLLENNGDVVGLVDMLEAYARKNIKGANEIFDKVKSDYAELDPKSIEFAEERFNALKDAYRKKQSIRRLDKTFSGKLLAAWNKIKGKDKTSDNQVQTGEDVLNLMTSFVDSFEKGELSGSFKALMEGRLKTIKAETAQKVKDGTIKKSQAGLTQEKLNSRVDDLVGNKSDGKYTWGSKEEWQMSEEFANTYEQIIGGNLIDPLIRRGIEGDSVYGVPIEDFVEQVKDKLSDLLINFDPTRNNSLIGYINSQLSFRKGDVLNKLKAKQPTQAKSIDTEAGEAGAVTGMEMMSTEEADAAIELEQRAAKEEAEIKQPLVKRLKFKDKPAIINKIKTKLAERVKYRISLFDAAKSKNKFTTDFVRDIHKDLQEVTYEAVLDAIGYSAFTTEQMENFLRDNYVSILDGLTTTYLSRAFPQAIEKKIVGEGYVKYPKWDGAKRGAQPGDIEFWKATEEGPFKGNTSGPQKIRRVKNIANEIKPVDFVGKYIKNGEIQKLPSIALAKQIGAELGIDLLIEDIKNNGDIAQALFERQELIRGMASTMAATDVIYQLERPGIKFSRYTGKVSWAPLDNSRNDLKNYLRNFSQTRIEEILEGIDVPPKFIELYNIFEKRYNEYLLRDNANLGKAVQENWKKFKENGFDKKGASHLLKINAESLYNEFAYNLGLHPFEIDKKNVEGYIFAVEKGITDFIREKGIEAKNKTEFIINAIGTFQGALMGAGKIGFGNNQAIFDYFIPLMKEIGMSNTEINKFSLLTVKKDKSTIAYEGNPILTIQTQETKSADIKNTIAGKPNSEGQIKNTINFKDRNKSAKQDEKLYIDYSKWLRKQYQAGYITVKEVAMIGNLLHGSYMRAIGKALTPVKHVLLFKQFKKDSNYTYEHLIPSNFLKIAFANYILDPSSPENALEKLQTVIDKSGVIIVPKEIAKIIDSKFQDGFGPGFDVNINDPLSYRYFDKGVQARLKKVGLDFDPIDIQDVNSEYFTEKSGIKQSKINIKYSLDTKLDDNGKPVYFYPEYSDMEDLDSPIYSWTSDLFKVGPLKENEYYSVEASVLSGKNGPGIDIMFGLIETGQAELNMIKTNTGITNQFKNNSKSPLKVFSIIGNALLDFLKENPQYNFVQFSGTDLSRIRLYDRLAKMLAQELGWKFDVNREAYQSEDDAASYIEVSEYIVTKPASIKQSKVSKQRQKLIDNNNNILPANQRLKGKNISNQEVLRKMKGLDEKDVKIRLSKINETMLDKQINIMLEQTTGVKADSEYSDARAKAAAQFQGKKYWWIPPSAQDFMGLMYKFIGKGKVGDAQLKWIKKNLIDPYARANEEITRARRAMYRDYKALKDQLNIVPKDLRERIPDSDFTVEQAVRAYIFTQEGHEIPGLSEKEARELKQYVAQRADLIDFATKIRSLLKGTQMAKPRPSWLGGTITTDLLETLNTTARAQALAEWQANVDVIFSKKNLNKIEAIYGSNFRYALENILNRMKTGKNRNYGPDSLTGRFMDWVNNQTGTIMFFNTRSAVLQTISSINFLNWTDNNPLQAAKAFANQKQYWTDFWDLFNSDFLVDRRDGLRMEVNENDIADMAKKGYGFQAMVGKLLKAGFLPTQIADSFAIAAGGATFYRNRYNTYIKEGMDPAKAKELAFREFRETAEESQQSSRPDKISQQQAGNLGRFVLAFANTPAQYARLMNKAFLDLKNGRGDAKTNISKILYYGAVQNILFNALQQALFALAFDDEDEEETNERYLKIANGMGDSVLRGMGIHGAIISTLKNTAIKMYTESQKGRNAEYGLNLITELAGISPPVQSKIRKLKSAGKSVEYNLDDMKKMGWDIDNPAYLAGANVIAATTNLPTDRVIKKTQNINEALTGDIEMMQRIALLSGWGKWELGLQEKKSKNKNSSSGFKKGGFKKGGF